LHVSRDQRCRAATVRVHNGLLQRPIQKLYKLELGASVDTRPQLTVDNDTPVVVDQTADSVDNSDAVAVG